MAYVEVELTEEEMSGGGLSYFRFTTLGDTLAGRFVRTQAATGQYAKPGQLDYVFKMKLEDGSVGEKAISPPVDAARRLEKANKLGHLTPGAAVLLKYVDDKDIGKEKPMRVFSLKIDPTGAASKPAKVVVPPPPAADDDLPF